MKILLFYTHDFWMKPFAKNLAHAQDRNEALAAEACVVALIHAEPNDLERAGKVVTKAIKNIKWVAGKFDSKRVVLHFFAHLAKESADPEDADLLVQRMGERLERTGYEVRITPFGYFTEFKLHVAGESMGKVWVDI